MPTELDETAAIEKASEYERQYSWAKAAKCYEQVLNSEKRSSSSLSTLEKLGVCYSFACTQANSLEEFTKLRLQAVDAYRMAAQIYEKDGSSKGQGRSANYEAKAHYLESWLISDPQKRRECLDKCHSSSLKSLETFQSIGDKLNYGRACNDLLICLLERMCIASDSGEMRNLALEGVEYSKISVDVLSKLGNESELLRTYFTSSLLFWYAHGCMPDLKDLVQTSLQHSEQALMLSEKVDNLYHSARSHWAAALCKLIFTEKADMAQKHAEQMLEYGDVLKDNYIKGVAYYILAFVTNWLAIREPDPDKKKKEHEKTIKHSKDAIRHLQLASQDFFIAETCLFYAEAYTSLTRDFAPRLEEKNTMLKKAIEIGRDGLKHAMRSGSLDATGSTLHALSKALHFYANLKTVNDEKRELLEESLQHRKEYVDVTERAFPANDWICGVGKSYEGIIKADLAKIETIKDKRIATLESATSDLEDGVKHCENWVSTRFVPTQLVAVAKFEDDFGRILNDLYLLTKKESLLVKSIETHELAAKNYKKANLSSRVAESHWKIAQTQELLGNYKKAAKNFENAHTEYTVAAKEIPQFADFYQGYASYMKAWSEIERAKSAHEQKEYSSAMSYYQKSANLLNQSKPWSYLSSNFHAWAFLEKAEDCSRNEKIEESIEAFKKAIDLFSESRGFLRVELAKIEKSDEKALAERLVVVSNTRARFCHGRLALEEARILDRQGEHKASAEKYGLAANTFRQTIEFDSEQSSKEMEQLVHFCQAWQKMMMAEARASPAMYGEAAELFKLAKDYSLDQASSSFALANSSFCRALEAGAEFETTRDKKLYMASKRHMEAAANYYLKAGSKTASAYAEGTQRLFDAYIFMDNAKRETDPDKEARFYVMAEKVLQASITSYKTAKHPEKTAQVSQLLVRVSKERELAISLSEVLHAPTITSSTESFVTLTPTEEKAVGLERFEHADIQAKLVQHMIETRIGDTFTLEMQIVNVGKEAVLLDKIEGIVPEGFEPALLPDYCQIEGQHLIMKAKQLNPLRTEEIAISLRPIEKGTFPINPRIVCIDQNGNQIDRKPQPTKIEVLEATLPGRITTGYRDLDNLLLGGVPEGYAVILASPSCDERDLLVRRFLEAGAKEGQTVFYVTIEASGVIDLAEEFQSNFHLFVCNPRADSIVKSQPNIVKLKGVENLTDINIALSSAFRQLDTSPKRPRRACIEIISDVLLQHHAVITRKWLTGLLPDLKSRGFSTLTIINPMMHSSEEVHAIVGLFDGRIRIYEKDIEGGLRKFLKVEKLYNKKYLDTELLLRKEKLEA
ncbi:MAG: hypothetical protein JSV05_02210 [Candidatus Bathyarchaeota archaeon]|nr:MAG: hypothetical protein JSV05_02210 [Candidatus Bathyarchaeota archaeon]